MGTLATSNPRRDRGGVASIYAFALVVVASVAGVFFLAGWLIGRILS